MRLNGLNLIVRFELGPKEGGREVSIEEYYKDKYRIDLVMPLLPVVEVKPGRNTFVPAEFLE